MCGRFTLTASPTDLAAHFEIGVQGVEIGADGGGLEGLSPRYNVAPGQDVLVVVHEGGARGFARKRWGLVPPWARDPTFGNQAINARIESADRKPAFRDAFARRRCLVPADGFYEWRARGRQREPHHVQLPDRALFAIAGLHEVWHGTDGDRVESCTLLTGPAHERIRDLHDRMPLLVPTDRYGAWLDPEREDPDLVRGLLAPEMAAAFQVRAVDPRVNSPRFDDPECLGPPPQLGLFDGS